MVVGSLDCVHCRFPTDLPARVSFKSGICGTFHSCLASSTYVAYPKIAQDGINDSTLDIKEMIITNPTPEAFTLEQTQVIGSDSPWHPKIFEFDSDVSLAGAPKPFSRVTVPSVQSKDGAVINFKQTVALTDAKAFSDYTTAVMLNEEISLNIFGKPDLKQGGLPTTQVTYNKTVVMKGMFFNL
jgi:hypothetical protein